MPMARTSKISGTVGRSVASAPHAAARSTQEARPADGLTASGRATRAAGRRAAILDAALDEFTARGFAATRLDDVAKRAGVAKGTIYLHFADKEALFQDLLRANLVPLLARLATPPTPQTSAREMIEQFVDTFVREVIATRRADVIRLVIMEGARFPQLADFHFRAVVEPSLAAMRRMIEHGVARGEIRHAGLARFPFLVVAPALLSIIWQGLFSRSAPLDVQTMLRAHLDLIFDERPSS
jgi:AcrR family transcriptional regulator